MFRTRQIYLAILMLTMSACVPCQAGADNPRFTPLVRAVENCREFVVNIHTEKDAVDSQDSRFFTPKSRRVSGMGTGIVVDERGYIVTNYHVIHEVDTITVTLKDGETLSARTVSFDRKHDMAIIQINASRPLQVMPIGTSSDIRLAEQVFAVGNAFGYEYSVTAGIVSALGRDVEVDETQSYENLIQTDASINPGNSGGPLLNVMGEVIGINVAIRAGAQRIGFAIPIDDARLTISRLLSAERLDGVAHGLLGRDIKTPDEKKLVVAEVAPGSAAASCGIEKGDTVRTVRGITIHDTADWERCLLGMPVGSVLDVDVTRDGEPVSLKLTVGVGNSRTAAVAANTQTTAQPVSAARTAVPSNESVRARARRLFGINLANLNQRDRNSINGRFNGGMKVISVSNGSPAERYGVQVGDILLGLDGFETLNDRSLEYILQDARLQNLKSVKFQVFRRNQSLVGHMVPNGTK